MSIVITIDMGGGSTEINLVRNGSVIISETHPIGAVRLLELIRAESLEDNESSRLVRGYAHGICAQLKRQINSRRIGICVGTGGSFEALGDLRTTLLKLDRSDTLTISELSQIIKGLSSLSLEERIDKLGLRPDRADVIAPAAEVLLEIMSAAGVKRIKLPRVGLRDGVILDLKAQVHPLLTQERSRHCLAFASEMVRLYSLDKKHSEHVRSHALYLFDRFKAVHRLERRERLLLELAALLHDIGRFVNSEDHHKHSMYIIKATQFIGLDQRERDIVACIARYHRGSLPKQSHEVYGALSGRDQRIVRRLAAFLRIADAADQGLGRVKRISLRMVKRSHCSIKLVGRGDLTLERVSCRSRGDLFSQEFKRAVTVTTYSAN
jgi:exopolyphosphatase/guanosine-5'-triphosphate,3'-diphosphate pyrophosphatase